MQLHGLNRTYFASFEAMSFAKCFEAYAENCSGSGIFEIGFDENKGIAYIALEMEPIIIYSFIGNRAQYEFTDTDNGKKFTFDSYKEAVEADNKITLH